MLAQVAHLQHGHQRDVAPLTACARAPPNGLVAPRGARVVGARARVGLILGLTQHLTPALLAADWRTDECAEEGGNSLLRPELHSENSPLLPDTHLGGVAPLSHLTLNPTLIFGPKKS